MWALVLVTLTSWPSPPPVATNVPGIDKVVHAALYAVLAWLVVDALPIESAHRLRALVLVVAGASAFGWVDEWHQQFIPGRSRDVRDWLADTLGAVTAVALRRTSSRTPLPRP